MLSFVIFKEVGRKGHAREVEIGIFPDVRPFARSCHVGRASSGLVLIQTLLQQNKDRYPVAVVLKFEIYICERRSVKFLEASTSLARL
jgi:hypothetical protein